MRYYLAMWCSEGFECLQDITQYSPEHQSDAQLVDMLKGQSAQPNPLDRQLHMMKLRAQVNRQRNYEIYAFTADDSISIEDLQLMSEYDPQTLVNKIRDCGEKIYGSAYRARTPVIV